MTKCYVCGLSIHGQHKEGELMKCLRYASKYIDEMTELVEKLVILNGVKP